jgi:anti-sigma regulatory factor (Ser/Thr protein kinase)
MKSTRRFRCQPESVAGARHFVRDILSDQQRGIVEAVELMTSELATNSVRHARSDFELVVHLSPDEIRVEVSDHGQGQPVPRSPTPQEQSGRGLQIVQQLAEDWGVAPSPNGKLVWFTLRACTHTGEHDDRSIISSERAPKQSRQPERGHEVAPCPSQSGISQLTKAVSTPLRAMSNSVVRVLAQAGDGALADLLSFPVAVP